MDKVIKKELRDQVAHIAAFLVVVGIPLFFPSVLACVISGFLFGFVIEVKERGSTITMENVKKALHSWKDLLGYSAGGLLLGMMLFA